MTKLTLNTAAALVALVVPALAVSQVWNVTEESASGIKGGQGTWTLKIDNNKISGSANMQLNNGAILTYDVDGSISGGIYTVTMFNRSDGKNGCVWTGHSPATGSETSRGLIGKVACDGGAAFAVRAGF